MPLTRWFTKSPALRPASYPKVHLYLETLEQRDAPALLGQQLYPDDNPWNQYIANAPVAANSAAIMSHIITQYGDGRLHPDFGEQYQNGNDLYGIPINIVHGNTAPKFNVVINAYPNESDIVPTPFPANVVLEGDYQNGPKAGVNNRGDSHLIIWDQDNNIAYEFYRASRPGENADGKWHADQQTVWDMKTNTFRTIGWTSADAAGLSILAGLVRPDEGLPVSQGGQGLIDHAIRFTLRNQVILDQFLYPASHTANPGNNNPAIMPPMGARFRLKASVDISQMNPQSRIVAQAMKDYGMILADNGSNFYFSGASYSVGANNQFTVTWDDDDVQSTTRGLKSLRYSDFEIVDLTPIVTGLSSHQAAAGSTITITGQNFTGAAGQLRVYFGSTQATGVTIVNDGQLTVVVPPGSGTVNVRVQSGITTPANPDNIKSTIFGYGSSANTPADDFTFGAPVNTPPTVAMPARSTSSPVRGTTTLLRVLGADNSGEANLVYTWSVVSKPAGAADPTFSLNGSNAAKDSVATFRKAGNYTFRVTIADAEGLTTSSSVTVSVIQTMTRMTLTPGTATLAPGGRLQFVATAFDQFDDALVRQPSFAWRLTGKGSLSTRGLYIAPARVGGPYTITARYGSFSASATVNVA